MSKKVCETKIAFGLKNNLGIATSGSTEFDKEDGNPVVKEIRLLTAILETKSIK